MAHLRKQLSVSTLVDILSVVTFTIPSNLEATRILNERRGCSLLVASSVKTTFCIHRALHLTKTLKFGGNEDMSNSSMSIVTSHINHCYNLIKCTQCQVTSIRLYYYPRLPILVRSTNHSFHPVDTSICYTVVFPNKSINTPRDTLRLDAALELCVWALHIWFVEYL